MTSRHGLTRRQFLSTLAMGVGVSAIGGCGSDDSGATLDYPDDWFQNSLYGAMAVFLGQDPGWNDKVDAFDVELFAEHMALAQAGYVLFTLGQNSGYYCSPNATYDRYTGYEAGDRCSVRDLPMDLADALASRGIPLMLYLPARAPQYDPNALAGLSAHAENDQFRPATQEFIRKWSEVIEEWSSRYATKVRGWWFDGAYVTNGWDDLSMPYNWNTWAAACRAGNPRSLLAFNRGAFDNAAFISSSDQQDYTAGEQNTFTATPETHPAPDGVQWHILCHMGPTWGAWTDDGPQLSDAEMIAYIEEVNALGGVVTIDVNAAGGSTIDEVERKDGEVYHPHLRQLEAIAAAIRPT